MMWKAFLLFFILAVNLAVGWNERWEEGRPHRHEVGRGHGGFERHGSHGHGHGHGHGRGHHHRRRNGTTLAPGTAAPVPFTIAPSTSA
uniref:Uncharacterized protein n=1 Tax=Steinernema glaseri TaxID=37863 RepID=A0A1I7XYU2_9BILA